MGDDREILNPVVIDDGVRVVRMEAAVEMVRPDAKDSDKNQNRCEPP